MKTLILSVLLGALCDSTLTAERPNIIVILANDMGYGDLACYGNLLAKTSHLDQLAKEGMRFTDFYAPSTVYSPSRAGLLTGRNPHRAGI